MGVLKTNDLHVVVASCEVVEPPKSEVIRPTVIRAISVADVYVHASSKPSLQSCNEVSVHDAALDPWGDDQQSLLGSVEGTRQQRRVLVHVHASYPHVLDTLGDLSFRLMPTLMRFPRRPDGLDLVAGDPLRFKLRSKSGPGFRMSDGYA